MNNIFSVERLRARLSSVHNYKILRVGFVALVGVNLTILFILMLRGIVTTPQDLELGIIKIHLYSLALLAAFLSCTLLVNYFMKHEPKFAGVDVWEGLVFVFLPAILGARIYHVVSDFQLYRDHLTNIFAVWNGGLGFIGGLVGGAIGLYIFARYRKIAVIDLIGIVTVVVPLGQAIGRLGNFFNHELYGPPTKLPWGEFIPEAFRKPELGNFAYYHPLFLYEALANLALFGILLWLYRRGTRGMQLIVVYAAGYGIIRFSLDFLRLDGNSGVYGLTYSQWLIAGGFILFCLAIVLKPIVLRIIKLIKQK